MICPGWRARCCHCVRNIPVSVVFFPLEKKSGCVCRPVSSGTEMAEHTLDVQYYIWQDDMSGRLLFSALLAAAKRGVRVRLLLDDNNTPGLDDILRLLDSHPRIEVRLFLILSRFACYVRLVISPTFPVSIAVCTIKVSLSMAW